MSNVASGKEDDYRYLRSWLAASDWLDRLIEATEPHRDGVAAPASAPVSTVAQSASRPRGFRAGCAARLARLALALNREAAAGAVLRR
jgi:hypothetical protein